MSNEVLSDFCTLLVLGASKNETVCYLMQLFNVFSHELLMYPAGCFWERFSEHRGQNVSFKCSTNVIKLREEQNIPNIIVKLDLT